MPRRYPEYTPERIKESKSYQVLLPKFNARRWAFGCSEWQDHGVDYSFEYVQDGFFHGFRLLGQVKGSSHLKFGNADSFSYALPVKTANYAVECSQRVNRPEACGLRHLAFCVESVEQTVRELVEVGIECEPIRVDSYTGKKMTFFHDPDGLPLELHE